MINISELSIMLLNYAGMLSYFSALLHYFVITCLSVPTVLYHKHILDEIRIHTLPKLSIQIV